MPKYLAIAQVLRERIHNQTYPAGTYLPNQISLVAEFDASRMTIKKAINLLIMEGLLFSKRGAGTLVLDSSFGQQDTSPVNEYFGLSNLMRQQKRHLTSQVLTFETVLPTEKIQQMLKISPQEPVYHIIRLRILDDAPYVLEHSYMPVQNVPALSTTILENSIYDYLQNDLNLLIGGAYRTLQAAKPDALDEKYLHCQKDDPVLEVKQVIYLDSGLPIDYSRSRSRYDVRSYSMLDVKFSHAT